MRPSGRLDRSLSLVVAEWMGPDVMPEMKKGAGASPLFVIDAPNR